MAKYIPGKIEKKWQRVWFKNRVFEPGLKKAQRPFYNLMMFPYPSAEGLHVGNMYAFTGSDIYGRFKRLQGFDVFEPIGLDGFGIHSENYALKIGAHPMRLAKVTQKRFYEQLRATGNSYAWSRKLETYSPDYYKWTQWLFLRLYRAGLAYRKTAAANFCLSCKTVLADEQVIQDKCERCGSQVEARFLKQWFFKITAYAERLLKNLDKIDWSERVKIAQRNWIGRSEGAMVRFSIVNLQFSIEVFTTRLDTIFGATFLALSPFHELITDNQLPLNGQAKRYVAAARKKAKAAASEGDKSGVFSGFYAFNPATDQKMPIWISDYILATYGTGAIMGVPAHDQRDSEFAQKFKLPTVKVIQPSRERKFQMQNPKSQIQDSKQAYEGEGTLMNSGQFNGMRSEEARVKILQWLTSKGGAKYPLAKKTVSYHLRDWLVSRQRYWGCPIPIIYCARCGTVPVPEKDLPVKLPYIKNFKPLGTGESPLASYPKFYKTKCPECDGPATRETDVCDTFLDSTWYYLGYLMRKSKFKNQNDKPKFKNFKSQFNQAALKRWLPVDMYIGGAEHSVLHLMYSRFVAMVLKDLGFVAFEEPFKKFRAHGLLIAEGAKMSKSKGNVVVPDDYIKKYGADTLRMYLMFLGPFEQGGDFRDEGIIGIWRFLNRVWQLAINYKSKILNSNQILNSNVQNSKLSKLMHQTIRKVTADIENLRFNTAISQLMIYQNALSENFAGIGSLHIKTLLLLLAPFAPHISEELWQQLNISTNQHKSAPNKSASIFQEKWPKYDPKLIAEKTFRLIIQINGRTRDALEAPWGISRAEAEKLGRQSAKIQKWLQGQAIGKVIFVPDRLINFVPE